jgi:hypothetical protein
MPTGRSSGPADDGVPLSSVLEALGERTSSSALLFFALEGGDCGVLETDRAGV